MCWEDGLSSKSGLLWTDHFHTQHGIRRTLNAMPTPHTMRVECSVADLLSTFWGGLELRAYTLSYSTSLCVCVCVCVCVEP
jgi:hypothetical protein